MLAQPQPPLRPGGAHYEVTGIKTVRMQQRLLASVFLQVGQWGCLPTRAGAAGWCPTSEDPPEDYSLSLFLGNIKGITSLEWRVGSLCRGWSVTMATLLSVPYD